MLKHENTSLYYKNALCPKLFLEFYNILKDRFCKDADIDHRRSSSERDFWITHWKAFQKVTHNYGAIPTGNEYLYKMHNTAYEKNAEVVFKRKIFDVFARYCKADDLDDLLGSNQISFKARQAQVQYLQIKRIEEESSPVDVIKNLENYINTDWWLYFYGYNAKEKAIVRLKFRIGQHYAHYLFAEVENTQEKSHPDYTGFIDSQYSTKHFMVCNLRTKTNSRYLHLKFNISSERIADICLGHYSNYDDNNLISGTVVLQRGGDDYDTLEPKKFVGKELIAASGIPTEILNYLSDKRVNFTKIPRGIFSLKALNAWKKQYSVKRTLTDI